MVMSSKTALQTPKMGYKGGRGLSWSALSVRLLQLLGHDMGVSDYDGRTALHLASAEGHSAVVTFLLHKCNVQPDPADRYIVVKYCEM